MDPKACQKRLVDALDEGDWDEAEAALRDLREWAEKGGFAVVVSTQAPRQSEGNE